MNNLQRATQQWYFTQLLIHYSKALTSVSTPLKLNSTLIITCIFETKPHNVCPLQECLLVVHKLRSIIEMEMLRLILPLDLYDVI